MRCFPCFLMLLVPFIMSDALAKEDKKCGHELQNLAPSEGSLKYDISTADGRELFVRSLYKACFNQTLQGNHGSNSNRDFFTATLPVLTEIAAGDHRYVYNWQKNNGKWNASTGKQWNFSNFTYVENSGTDRAGEYKYPGAGQSPHIKVSDIAATQINSFIRNVSAWSDGSGKNSVVKTSDTVRINFDGYPEIIISSAPENVVSHTMAVPDGDIIADENRLYLSSAKTSYNLTLDISGLSDAEIARTRTIYAHLAANTHLFDFTLNCSDSAPENRCRNLDIAGVKFSSRYQDANEDEYFRISGNTDNGCSPSQFRFETCNDSSCSSASPYTGMVTLSDSLYSSNSSGTVWLAPASGNRNITASVTGKNGSIYLCGTAASPAAGCSFDIPGCHTATGTRTEQYINEPNSTLKVTMTGGIAGDTMTPESMEITFSSGNVPLTVKTSQGNSTIQAGKTGTLEIPVTVSGTADKVLTPNFTITSPHFPDSNTRVTGMTVKYRTTAEPAEVIPVRLSPETGDSFDIQVLSVPYAICGSAADTDGHAVTRLDIGREYRLKTYAAKCPDSGCPAEATGEKLKMICTAENKVAVTGKTYSRTLSDAFSLIDPAKLYRWQQNPSDTDSGAFIAGTSENGENSVLRLTQICATAPAPGFNTDSEYCLGIGNSAGWFSMASEKPYTELTSLKPTYFFSPVFAVYPSYMAINEGWLHITDDLYRKKVISQSQADFTNFSGVREISGTCPAYYGEPLSFSGFITGTDISGASVDYIPDAYLNTESSDTPFKAIITKITRDEAGNLTAGRSIRSGKDYTLDFNSTLDAHWMRPVYQSYSTKHGYPLRFTFITSRAELATPEEIRPGGWLNFSYCLPDNDNFANGCSGYLKITGRPNIRSLLPDGSPLEAKFDGTVSDSDKFTFFTPLSAAPKLHYGRLVSQITQGETDIIHTPVSLQYYAGNGNWNISDTDSCTELHLRNPDSKATENLIFSKTVSDYTDSGIRAALSAYEKIELIPVCHGTDIATGCQQNVNNFIENASGRFNRGYLWLQGTQINCKIRDNCALEYRLRSSGTLGENSLDHLYDSQTSNGGVIFKSHKSSARIIDRKEVYN